MMDDAAGLPRLDAGMIDAPVAQCARCGVPIYHSPAYVGRPDETDATLMTVVTVCNACAPIAAREVEYANNREFAARLDRAVAEVRDHLAEIERIVRFTPSPASVMLAGGVDTDWAALCHALLMCRYLAKRFSAAAIVEADIAAGGTGAGDAPRFTAKPAP